MAKRPKIVGEILKEVTTIIDANLEVTGTVKVHVTIKGCLNMGRIKEIRREKKITMESFASILGITRVYLWQLETASDTYEYCVPLAKAEYIAKALKVPLSDIYKWVHTVE